MLPSIRWYVSDRSITNLKEKDRENVVTEFSFDMNKWLNKSSKSKKTPAASGHPIIKKN